MKFEFLDRLFSGRIWKFAIGVTIGFLLWLCFRLFLLANASINFVAKLPNSTSSVNSEELQQAYSHGILAVFILAVLCILWIMRLVRDYVVAKEYRLLANTMVKFAEGTVSTRFTEKVSKEVDDLGRTFNQMANTIQGLIVELRRSEKRKNEIVASITHDLAGPITAISGYVQTVSKMLKPQITEESANCFNTINRNLATISKLVKELNELSTLEASELPMNKEQFSLKVLANDIVSRYAIQAKERSIMLTLDPASKDGLLVADMTKVERLISNLVENAIFYTPSGGSVTIIVSRDGDYVVAQVKDSGVGISEKDLPMVFERFYRADQNRSRKTGGSGLGLAIAKQIVELHGGKIDIESVLNKGTQVIVKLPAKR